MLISVAHVLVPPEIRDDVSSSSIVSVSESMETILISVSDVLVPTEISSIESVSDSMDTILKSDSRVLVSPEIRDDVTSSSIVSVP